MAQLVPPSLQLGVPFHSRTLIDRAEAIVSDPDDLTAEIEHVRKALQVCGYPKRVIDNVIRRRKIAKTKPAL